VDIPKLVTGRLVLRAPEDGDLAMLRAFEGDAEAMRSRGEGVTHPPEHAAVTLAGFLAEWLRVGHGRWTVAVRETGEAIGDCGFVRWREGESNSRPELAYGYVREAWGQGYATEAARAALEWAWATLPFDEIVALTHPENATSQRVLAKLGFEAAGEVVPSHGRRMAMFRLARPV
jgi:RimJ/RimL family protein N-acetyltransferase